MLYGSRLARTAAAVMVAGAEKDNDGIMESAPNVCVLLQTTKHPTLQGSGRQSSCNANQAVLTRHPTCELVA
jgi:hypothetical protein